MSVCLSVCLCLSLSVSACLCLSLSVFLQVWKRSYCETSSIFELDNVRNETILRDFLNFWTWQHPKRSNSERLPQFWNLTTSETNRFSETSSIFELDNIQNEAILRDFLNFGTWYHPKRSNYARLPEFLNLTTSKAKQFCETFFKYGKLSAELTASYQCILRFFHSTCLK